MVRWGLFGLILWYIMGEGCGVAQALFSASLMEEQSLHPIRAHKKKKKSAKPKKHKSKRRKPKGKIYSAHRIEKLLENDKGKGTCNRLNCASNLKIAKSCLRTKASYRKKKQCFRAFCAYGCNEEDYKNRPDVRGFCNRTCSSKKYLKKLEK